MEYRITLQVTDNRALVGVQRPDGDPFLKQVEVAGEDSTAILQSLGENLAPLVLEAEELWAASPRYPTYTPPKAAAPPAQPAKTKAEAIAALAPATASRLKSENSR